MKFSLYIPGLPDGLEWSLVVRIIVTINCLSFGPLSLFLVLFIFLSKVRQGLAKLFVSVGGLGRVSSKELSLNRLLTQVIFTPSIQ